MFEAIGGILGFIAIGFAIYVFIGVAAIAAKVALSAFVWMIMFLIPVVLLLAFCSAIAPGG